MMLLDNLARRAALVLLVAVPGGAGGEDRAAIPSVEAARAESEAFLRAYRDISTGYETATTKDQALLDAYIKANLEWDAANHPYREAVRRLTLSLGDNESVEVVNMDYKRAMAEAALVERNVDPYRARQLRNAAKVEYDKALKSAVEGTPIVEHVDAETAAYERLEDASDAQVAAMRALAKRSDNS